VIPLIDQARAAGIPVVPEVYPWTAGSTTVKGLVPWVAGGLAMHCYCNALAMPAR
jgi:hypothetical protein